MFIKTGCEIAIACDQPGPFIAMLQVHPERADALCAPDDVTAAPAIPLEPFLDQYGNRCVRGVLPVGELRLTAGTLVDEPFEPDAWVPDAPQLPVEALPVETLRFLLGSRYCEVDRLMGDAWALFGAVAPGWARVQAVCDWIHTNVVFGYAHARPNMTAWEVFERRAGVCRDFAHLAIAFCRALNIPARYGTGYLGDIDIEPEPFPMDVSAWFEVFLGGAWYTFDARFNTRRRGRILMARGRDAADCAVLTTFGPHRLVEWRVWTDEARDVPDSVISEAGARQALYGRR
ncbi:MAG: transglutaminase family protein [Alphaproteobacteria bacterium]|nr:transglutaminase family protein [Alphaproteobacteria bacterium]